MLQVKNLAAAYGESQILFDISFEINKGEVLTLLGRNGMGKTTTIKTIFGLLQAADGSVMINGQDMTFAPPHKIAKSGLGLVPEGRQIFPTLTVEENLVATSRAAPAPKSTLAGVPAWSLDQVYELFPQLLERRRNVGNQLSGGEQQMLAIGRALMTSPSLLVLDEATEGLAPLIRESIWSCLRTIRETGVAILIIDKNIDALTRFADRHVVIEKGRTVWSGDNAALVASSEIVDRYLHV